MTNRLFAIPLMIGSSDPQQWVQEVALVVRAKNSREPESKLAASLSEVISRHAHAFLDPYETYCDQRR